MITVIIGNKPVNCIAAISLSECNNYVDSTFEVLVALRTIFLCVHHEPIINSLCLYFAS